MFSQVRRNYTSDKYYVAALQTTKELLNPLTNLLITVIHEKGRFLSWTLRINVLISIFNRELFSNLFFLQEMDNFHLLDLSQPRTDVLKDLEKYFNPNLKIKRTFLNTSQLSSLLLKNQFNENIINIIIKSVA